MSRKVYDEYQSIAPKYKYVYPNTSVLINRQGIMDKVKATANEHFLVSQRLIELALAPMVIENMYDVRRIHAHLFLDLYEWAGEYREVNISKQGKAFMAMQAFSTGESYMDSLITTFIENANSRSEMIFHLARILDNLNYMHPFREGNGRTQREVTRALALSKGYIADIKVSTDEDVYHLYMDGTVYGRIDLLEKLFDKILEEV
jgi:cell filamentation protein